jgi:hypothetical protein
MTRLSPIAYKSFFFQCLALCVLLSDTSFPQNRTGKAPYDTIFVSGGMTTYMIFPENVAVMDLGSKGYVGKIESGNMLYLKPLSATVAPSSLLVRTTGDRIYLHYIAYRRQPDKIFWDYRADTLIEALPNGVNAAHAIPRPQMVYGQLEALKKQPKRKLYRYGSSGIKMTVSNLAVDREAVYVLIDVENHTSVPYKLDYVSFTYKERRSKKSPRRIVPQENVVEPLEGQVADVVAPRGKACLAYALPLYAGTHKGFLEVVVREANGNRLLSGIIRAREIARSAYLASPNNAGTAQSASAKDSTSHIQSHVPPTNPRKNNK